MELSEFQANQLLRAVVASCSGLSAFAGAGAAGQVHGVVGKLKSLTVHHHVKSFLRKVIEERKEERMGQSDQVLAAMCRDGHEDMGSEGEKQRCCKQGHDDLHSDSILGGVFFLQECVSGWNVGRRA